MVVPSRLADTVTPSSLPPDAEVIDPANSWSAAWAPVAIAKLAAVASKRLRIVIIILLWSLFESLGNQVENEGASARRRRCGHRDRAHIGDDGVDLVGLEVVLEAGHARRAIHDVLAH